MITASSRILQPEHWQQQLSRAITDPKQLIELLGLPSHLLEAAERASRLFPLRVTRHFAGLIQHGDPRDPLLRQVLPLDAEFLAAPGFVTDPVDDHAATLSSGLLHKYAGRALLITTGACAVHCRYCFRRHYPYAEENALRHQTEVIQQLTRRTDIDEVILSGGDPLSLSDQRLQDLLKAFDNIPHLKRLRLHTRLPVALPERITPSLVSALAESRLACSLVLHSNHPNELAGELRAKLGTLREARITLLNQAVLLAGVNDHVETLVSLSETLFDSGVLPYYLHLLDPVEGASHFDVDLKEARSIEQQLRQRLPGYLVPRMVREVPGHSGKTPLQELR